jgi:3-hydroxyacyl-CoA dehydrogenase
MKLLEIVKGSKTSPVALAMGYAVAKSLGKMPVVAGVCDGFIGNRILAALREAADATLMDGSTPAEIDRTMVAFGYAMGPYETQDLSGLDIAHANRRRLDASRDPSRRYIPIADCLVTQNRLGKKNGAGWYHYPNGNIAVDPKVEDIICREAEAANIKRRHFSSDEIQQRLLLAMINEAANTLNEGIAVSAADIDLVLVHGYGFPRWRGGLMHYADQLGATLVMAELTKLCDEDPLFWQPSRLIIDCAKTGRDFASYNDQSAKQPIL